MMDLFVEIEGVVSECREINSSSVQFADTMIAKIEICLEMMDDFVAFVSSLPMTNDSVTYYNTCIELQSVISQLLILWQIRFLQTSQPLQPGRPKVLINIELVRHDIAFHLY